MYPLMSFGWLTVFLGLFSSATSAQTDPELGTWTLNRARSSYDPGPPLNSQVRKVETVGEYQKLHNETVTGDGTLAIVGYIAKFDGRDYPVTGSPYGDMVRLKRLDSHTVEAVVTKAGKIVLTDTRVVSPDGEVLTITQIGVSPSSRPMHNVLVYDKTR